MGLLAEDLTEREIARLDTLEASHLPRETVYVEPESGEAVPAQLYRRRTGSHTERLPGQRGGRRRAADLRLRPVAAVS